ncbi:MAG: hypothetical protein R3C56_39960 [Pirellulaceae bacterium]
MPIPEQLLTGTYLTEVVAPPIMLDSPNFRDRMEFGSWLFKLAQENEWEVPRRDRGFWSWLTLFFFEQVCPSDAGGVRKVREHAWYIPAFDDSRRHYRHILYGSFEVYYQFRHDPTAAGLLLSIDLTTVGQFWFQLVSRQELITNPSVVGAATQLYLDQASGKAKRGATSQGPGGIFRFVKVMNQFDRVWDLRLRGVAGILELLPREFEKFGSKQI